MKIGDVMKMEYLYKMCSVCAIFKERKYSENVKGKWFRKTRNVAQEGERKTVRTIIKENSFSSPLSTIYKIR